jgi:hypothetical protein
LFKQFYIWHKRGDKNLNKVFWLRKPQSNARTIYRLILFFDQTDLLNMKKICTLFLAFCCAAAVAGQQQYPVRFASGTEYFPENYAEFRNKNAADAPEIVNGYYAGPDGRRTRCAGNGGRAVHRIRAIRRVPDGDPAGF